MLIGDLTWRLVREAVSVEPVEPLELKGKAERVPAYRLIEVSDAVEGFARQQTAPMVGRADELRRLHDLFDEVVTTGGCAVATVVGEAGVGKSRLVRELVGSLPADVIVVKGRCLSYGDGITFWPFIEAARDAASIAADDPPEIGIEKLRAVAEHDEIVDRIAAVIGFSDQPFAVPELFWGIRSWLERLAAERPVLWVIEDIHWAEPTFLDLINHLRDTIDSGSVALLCTSRHDLLDKFPDWGSEERARLIKLEPLDDAAAAEIVGNLLGAAGMPKDLERRIVAAAEGNPLFVEQLLGMLVDTGRLSESDAGWVTTADIAQLDLPPTIHALLAARLDLLAREERAVIEPAAVIGLEFLVGAVEELVVDRLRPSVSTHLAEVTRKQLIRPMRATGSDDDGYRFGHILIRDAAYAGLLKRARAELHERFVAWADRVNAEHDRATEFEEILGYHLEQAYRYLGDLGPLDDHGRGLGARASERLGRAGRRAMLRGDMPAAGNLLRRAADVIEQSPEQVALLIDLGEVLSEMGSFAEAEEVLSEALRAAHSIGDARLAVKARVAQLSAQLYAGAGDDWTAQVDETVALALPRFEAESDHDGLALAWRLVTGRNAMAMRWGDTADAAKQVVTHGRAAGNLRYETRGASGYANALLLGPTPVPEAIVECRELLEGVDSDRRSSAFIKISLAQLTAMDNRIEEGRALYQESVAQLRELGSAMLADSSSIDSAQIEYLSGDLREAERLLRADHDALSRMGERYLLPSIDGRLARVLYTLDAFDEAEEIALSAREMAMEDDLDAQAMWRSVLAMVRARQGSLEEAVALGDEAIALRRRSDAIVLLADTLADFSEVLRFTGRDDEVRAVRNEALKLYERKRDVVSAGRLRAVLS